MGRFQSSVLSALVSLVCVAPCVAADYYRLQHIFKVPELENGAAFGSEVALENGVAVFKSGSNYGTFPYSTLTTHLFEETATGNWIETNRLALEDYFVAYPNGQGLAINDGHIVMAYSGSGASRWRSPRFASLNADKEWEEEFQAVVPFWLDPFAPSGFTSAGRSVDVSGDYAIASDAGAERTFGESGVARVFKRNTTGRWDEVANLWDESSADLDFNVQSVSIDGTHAMAISRGFSFSVGGLFAFHRNSAGEWSQSAGFKGVTPDGFEPWGSSSVILDGDAAVVRNFVSGATHVYEISSDGNWAYAQQLHPHAVDSNQMLIGRTAALENDLLAVTVVGENGSPNEVQLYRRRGFGDWALFDSIAAPLNEPEFGAALSLDNGRLLVGTNQTDAFEPDDPPGVAYLFVPVPEPNSLAITGLTLVAVLLGRTANAKRFTRNT